MLIPRYDALWRMRLARHLCVLIVAAGAIVALMYIIGLVAPFR